MAKTGRSPSRNLGRAAVPATGVPAAAARASSAPTAESSLPPMGRRVPAALILAALCAGGAPARAAPTAPDDVSVSIPFSNAAPDGGPLTASPRLFVGFDGGAETEFVMDTGSQGVVVSRDVWSPPPDATQLGRGRVDYTSSGVVLDGVWYEASIAIGSGAQSAVASVPALVVDAVRCQRGARHCAPDGDPGHVAMFGVGFGQEAHGQPGGTPDKNPFLNIVAIGGRPVTVAAKGYVVTAQGVTLGLTAENTAGFRFMPLERDAEGRDWRRAPVTITVNGVSGPGTGLTDTGIRYMFLRPPPGAALQTIPVERATGPCVRYKPCAAEGARIGIAFGDPSAPALAYEVVVGADGVPLPGAAAPAWVTTLPERASAFVNTSYHFFNAYDYVFDAVGGRVGFRAARGLR